MDDDKQPVQVGRGDIGREPPPVGGLLVADLEEGLVICRKRRQYGVPGGCRQELAGKGRECLGRQNGIAHDSLVNGRGELGQDRGSAAQDRAARDVVEAVGGDERVGPRHGKPGSGQFDVTDAVLAI
ncbi:MAG: hypothetical protein HC888_17530 [Candidatus Competibacteraceae bacterium]|nr:hypothetical protein [Candidatus Competibacteraceae bacterium]